MKACFILFAGALTLSACSKANASGLDPSNPLHCGAQFQSYSFIAKQQGDDLKQKGFALRAAWYGEQARSVGAQQLTPNAQSELADRILSAPDGGLALATECFKRQEADPDWQRLIRTK
jgi:hypothetical protein